VAFCLKCNFVRKDLNFNEKLLLTNNEVLGCICGGIYKVLKIIEVIDVRNMEAKNRRNVF
jgi:hypothetical protein